MPYKQLGRQFFTRPVLEVAKDILGKFLVHQYQGKKMVGKIVEVEVYAGADDRASHAFGGKKTARNLAEYLVGGHVYIYLVYGMYWQFNISTGLIDEPECILIRALEPTHLSFPRKRESKKNESRSRIKYGMTDLRKIASGPGRLCRWMKLDKSFYGYDLCRKGAELYIEDRGPKLNASQIACGPRIGIDYAGPYWSQIPWRFWIKNNWFVSQ